MRKILIAAVLLVVLTAAAVLVVPGFIDWNRYKDEIAATIEQATGRAITINGDLRFTVLPAPTLSAADVHLANIPGARYAEMITLGALDIRVAPMPLLGGNIQVSSVKLVDPVIALEVLKDGRANFRSPGAREEEGGGGGAHIGFDDVDIVNGTVLYFDARSGREERVEGLDVSISARSLSGPFEAKGRATVRGQKLSFEIQIGDLSRQQAIPVTVELATGDEGVEFTFSGWASEASAEARLNGRLTMGAGRLGGALEKVLDLAGVSVQGPALGLGHEIALETHISADRAEARLRDISLRIGRDTATGSLNASYADDIEFDGELSLTSLDLDPWIEPWLKDRQAPAPEGAAKPEAEITPLIPRRLKGQVRIDIGGLTYRGGVARRIKVILGAANGQIELAKATASLPGGTELDLSGALRASDTGPRFDGRTSLTSDNLRGLLSWLDLEPPVAMDRLTQFSVAGTITATPRIFQIYGAEMKLDGATFSGGLSLGLGERRALGVDLSVDQLNLDAYLPREKTGQTAPGQGQGAGFAGVAGAADIAALAGAVDAGFKIKAGLLTLGGVAVTGLRAEGSLVGGRLDLKTLRADDIAGAEIAISGVFDDFGGKVGMDGRLRISSADPARLFQLLAVKPPVALGGLRDARLGLSLKGSLDSLRIDLDAAFGKTEIHLAGSAERLATDLALIDLAIAGNNASYGRFLEQFELDLPRPSPDWDGPVALKGRLRGGLGSLDISLTADIAGGSVSADGKLVKALTAPAFDGAVTLRHRDLRSFVRGLGFDFDPAEAKLGALEVNVGLAASARQVRLSDLTATLGPVSLSAAAVMDLTAARPLVTGTLSVGEVNLDLFMAEPETGLGPRATGGKRLARWSQEDFDLTWAGVFDAELAVTARRIEIAGYDFTAPEFEISLRDRVLEMTKAKARLFGGAADARFSLDGRGKPALDLTLNLSNADLAKALESSAGIERISGKFGLSGTFSAAGRTQLEMISNLAGTATIAARDGALRGIDLAALSKQLSAVQESADLLDIIVTTLSRGSTRFSAVDGVIAFDGGVGTSRNVKVDMDAAKVSLIATFDLPAWNLDAKTRFWLKDHPGAPAVGLDFFGPIDAPRRRLQTKELRIFIANLIGETLLRSLLNPDQGPPGGLLDILTAPGASSPAPASAPAPGPGESAPDTGKTKKPKPEELLLDIFRGLVKPARTPPDS